MKCPPGKRSVALTLIELLVIIAIITIFAAWSLPALSGAKKRATQTRCVDNLKQLGTATVMYLDENDGTFPGINVLTSRQNQTAVETFAEGHVQTVKCESGANPDWAPAGIDGQEWRRRWLAQFYMARKRAGIDHTLLFDGIPTLYEN